MMVKPKERVVRSVEATSITAWLRHRRGPSVVPLGETLEGVYRATRGRNELIRSGRRQRQPEMSLAGLGQMMVKLKERVVRRKPRRGCGMLFFEVSTLVVIFSECKNERG